MNKCTFFGPSSKNLMSLRERGILPVWESVKRMSDQSSALALKDARPDTALKKFAIVPDYAYKYENCFSTHKKTKLLRRYEAVRWKEIIPDLYRLRAIAAHITSSGKHQEYNIEYSVSTKIRRMRINKSGQKSTSHYSNTSDYRTNWNSRVRANLQKRRGMGKRKEEKGVRRDERKRHLAFAVVAPFDEVLALLGHHNALCLRPLNRNRRATINTNIIKKSHWKDEGKRKGAR